MGEHKALWKMGSTLEDGGAKNTVENGGNTALWRSWGHRVLLKVEVTLQRELQNLQAKAQVYKRQFSTSPGLEDESFLVHT